MKAIFTIIILFNINGCNRKNTIINEVPHFDESKVWEIVLGSDEFQEILKYYSPIIIHDQYTYRPKGPAYQENFNCMFYLYVLSPQTSDSIKTNYGRPFWGYAQKVSKERDKVYPVKTTKVADKYENVYFFNMDSLRAGKRPPNFTSKIGKILYPYGSPPEDYNGFSGLELSDDSYTSYNFTVDIDSCKVQRFFRSYYEFINCESRFDWVDLIDFNMSIDSFYQFQYFDLLKKLDSLDGSSYYQDLEQFKGKW